MNGIICDSNEQISQWAEPLATTVISLGHVTTPRDAISDESIWASLYEAVMRDQNSIVFVGSPLQKEVALSWPGRLVPEPPAERGPSARKFNHYSYVEFLDFCREDHEERGRHGWWSTDRFREMVIVFHLDINMSAECSLALIAAVHWATLKMHDINSVRVLTVSSESKPDALVGLASYFRLDPVRRLVLTIKDDDDEKRREVQHVVDTRSMDLHAEYRRQKRRGLERQMTIYSPSLIEMPAAMGITVDRYGLKTMNVEKTTDWDMFAMPMPVERISLPLEYDTLHLFLDSSREMAVFDTVTRQVTHTRVSISEQERADQLSLAFRTVKVPSCVAIYIDRSSTHEYLCAGRSRRRLRVCNSETGGFLAAFREFISRGLDEHVASCFFSTPMEKSSFTIMSHRLQIQMKRASPLGLNEGLFRSILPIVGYDHRLALFVALPTGSKAVRMKKIQWAAMAYVGAGNLLKFPDGESIMGRDNCQTLSVKYGSATPYLSYGSTWLALAFCSDMVKSVRNLPKFPPTQEWIESPETGVQISVAACLQFEGTVIALSKVRIGYGMTFPSDFSDLGDIDAREFQRHLLEAFVFQLTKTVDSNTSVVDLSMGTCFADNCVNTWVTEAARRSEETGPVFGVYSEMERAANGNTVRLRDWTWIPASIVKD
ncbi:hypothetical protein FSARC_14823 [Fusarium sarcochroum]|uniref:Uncharacterized protein n=1 Tax=Fusarium sarcochroum TaxID=1208366 RepID=A0A8H4SQI9_9HYPO|nr:hypothetical protein FSARC_14823 [Fusarium sarcochroum]